MKGCEDLKYMRRLASCTLFSKLAGISKNPTELTIYCTAKREKKSISRGCVGWHKVNEGT